jgi:hypothetical protein
MVETSQNNDLEDPYKKIYLGVYVSENEQKLGVLLLPLCAEC